jgi:hypothetical protein
MNMARNDNVRPLNELFDEKMEEFESGEDKEHDKDLDQMIWELGDFENEVPPQDAQEFKADAPIEEELVEKTMQQSEGGRVHLKEPEYLGDREPVKGKLIEVRPLRIEMAGEDCEIVCGLISMSRKKKIEAYCLGNDVTLSDIWYQDEIMSPLMGKRWRGWFKVDQFVHERGLGCRNATPFKMDFYFDDELVEEVDLDVARDRYELVPKPKPKTGCAALASGLCNDAKYIFKLDLADDFEPRKLTFHYKDLKNIGIDMLLLTEVRYANRVMSDNHEDYGNEDVLDVVFL